MSLRSSIVLTALLASLALARTDLTGCTSTDVSSPADASIAWYVPGTGELCDFLDCGGGTAPPKTTVPGCPLYPGTASYSPSYLPGYGSMTASAAASTSTSWESSASDTSSATDTGTAWSKTSETSSLANSAVGLSTLTTSTTLTITSAPAIVGTGSVYGGSTTGHNGTIASATPTSITPISTGGAMEAARVWVGGAGLLGLGAVVAAL